MSSSHTTDGQLERLFEILQAPTLRRRAHFEAQIGAPGVPVQTAVASASDAPARSTPEPTLDQQVERLFDILAAPTLRRRARFIAQSDASAWAGTRHAPRAADAPGNVTPWPTQDQQVERLFDLLAAPTLRRRARFIAQTAQAQPA